MSNLAIIRPIPGVSTGALVNPERTGTPDPKEVSYSVGAGIRDMDIDLGAAHLIGGFYVGAVSHEVQITVATGVAAHGEIHHDGLLDIAPKRTAGAPRQYLKLIAPIPVRFINMRIQNAPDGLEVGLALVGEVFRPTYGHEWGAGRYLVDTGTATRNRAGGFGIERGAIVPGWEFTLGDLTDEEREQLFDMVRKMGETSPVVVVEDPDNTADLDARIHYGLFQRLEKYERQSVGVTRWSFKVEEWL